MPVIEEEHLGAPQLRRLDWRRLLPSGSPWRVASTKASSAMISRSTSPMSASSASSAASSSPACNAAARTSVLSSRHATVSSGNRLRRRGAMLGSAYGAIVGMTADAQRPDERIARPLARVEQVHRHR
jgi:hypothetical protein